MARGGFKPISQFGVLMATLHGVALVGDLVHSPAILASPVFAWTVARRPHGGTTASQAS